MSCIATCPCTVFNHILFQRGGLESYVHVHTFMFSFIHQHTHILIYTLTMSVMYRSMSLHRALSHIIPKRRAWIICSCPAGCWHFSCSSACTISSSLPAFCSTSSSSLKSPLHTYVCVCVCVYIHAFVCAYIHI